MVKFEFLIVRFPFNAIRSHHVIRGFNVLKNERTIRYVTFIFSWLTSASVLRFIQINGLEITVFCIRNIQINKILRSVPLCNDFPLTYVRPSN